MSQFVGGGSTVPTPWYKENPFWGGVGGFFSFLFAGVGFGVTGHVTLGRWFLLGAFPWGVMAAWIALNGLTNQKSVRLCGRIALILVIGAILTLGAIWMGPPVDHARLEIDKVVAVPIAAKKAAYVFLNVTYNNLGKVTSIGFLSRASVVPLPAPRYMSKEEINNYRAKNSSTFVATDLKRILQDDRECYPNDPKIHYFSIPEEKGETADVLTKEFNNVISGTTLLYVFMTLLYRDHNMPTNVYGVTETCVYFVDNFDAVHECGNRSLLMEARDLTKDNPNAWPYR